MFTRIALALLLMLSGARDEISFAADHAADITQTLDAIADSPDSQVNSVNAARAYRWLMQLSSDERYQLLKTWSLRDDSPKVARVVSCDSRVTAPPKEFARVIGERPRDNSFATPQSTGTPGRFSTADMLVAAAKDAGRLRELALALESRSGTEAESILSLLTKPSPKTALPIDDASQLSNDWLRIFGDPNWLPVSRFWAKTHGDGRPEASWLATQGQVHSSRQHSDDMLLYGVPLMGDFTVECEIDVREHTESFLLAGGLQTQFRVWKSQLLTGTLDDGFSTSTIEPSPTKAYGWTRQRIEVKDGKRTIFLSGRSVDERTVPTNAYPWLCLCNVWGRPCGFRDLRITGTPQIPHELTLATDSLQGWLPYYYYKLSDPCGWSLNGSREIIGEKTTYTPGSGQESLIYYQRPILEDATIEYEFFYQAGLVAVHPAIDRKPFMHLPDGVRIHPVSDGKFETSGRSPIGLLKNTQSQRGESSIPLLENQWNRIQLKIVNDALQVKLNDTVVHETVVPASNHRFFGLFHYSDQTSARVRNIVYRGQWPRSLPPMREQQLVDKRVAELDKSAENLSAAFDYSFTHDGLDSKYFILQNAGQLRPQLDPQGVVTRAWSNGKWDHNGVTCTLCAAGDFDVTAEYSGIIVGSTS